MEPTNEHEPRSLIKHEISLGTKKPSNRFNTKAFYVWIKIKIPSSTDVPVPLIPSIVKSPLNFRDLQF
jgi:hypothetical protein